MVRRFDTLGLPTFLAQQFADELANQRFVFDYQNQVRSLHTQVRRAEKLVNSICRGCADER
ncbi:hypothetical protein AO269_24870 [Pseudomonas putida]|nr:hypothetical protein AO269_24870 [Pseudomonas putida]